MAWIMQNWGTIAVGLLLLALVAAILRSLLKNKKRGGSACCGGCAGCFMHGACHKKP